MPKQFFLTLLLLPSLALASSNCHHTSIRNVDLIDNLDGTITDTRARLMWKQCSEGQSGLLCEEGRSGSYTWNRAIMLPDEVNSTGGYADYNDWRLPTTFELKTLLDNECQQPAMDLDFFPATPASSWYWATSPVAGYEDDGSLISIDFSGNLNVMGNTSGKVRLVRDLK